MKLSLSLIALDMEYIAPYCSTNTRWYQSQNLLFLSGMHRTGSKVLNYKSYLKNLVAFFKINYVSPFYSSKNFSIFFMGSSFDRFLLKDPNSQYSQTCRLFKSIPLNLIINCFLNDRREENFQEKQFTLILYPFCQVKCKCNYDKILFTVDLKSG